VAGDVCLCKMVLVLYWTAVLSVVAGNTLDLVILWRPGANYLFIGRHGELVTKQECQLPF